jgi:tetratricopeptide (TPR) repeat protein
MYGVLGAYKKCVKAFDRALEIKKLPELLVRRGLCRNASEDVKGAVQDLQEALNMDSKYAPAYLHLGIIFKQQERTDEAKHNLEQAVANGEGTPIADQAKKELADLK